MKKTHLNFGWVFFVLTQITRITMNDKLTPEEVSKLLANDVSFFISFFLHFFQEEIIERINVKGYKISTRAGAYAFLMELANQGDVTTVNYIFDFDYDKSKIPEEYHESVDQLQNNN